MNYIFEIVKGRNNSALCLRGIIISYKEAKITLDVNETWHLLIQAIEEHTSKL